MVTGASQNIGEALATELAARGHSLIITARREDILTDLAARLADKYRVTVEVRPADLADPAERAKLCDELASRPISILCASSLASRPSSTECERLIKLNAQMSYEFTRPLETRKAAYGRQLVFLARLLNLALSQRRPRLRQGI